MTVGIILHDAHIFVLVLLKAITNIQNSGQHQKKRTDWKKLVSVPSERGTVRETFKPLFLDFL